MKEDYGFLNGGQTLEIRSTLLEKCRQNLEGQQLEQRYEQVNGSLYPPMLAKYDGSISSFSQLLESGDISNLKDKKVEYPEASGAVNIVRFGDAVDAVLSEIVFNGRELGVSCVVSTHSSNIDDLPFLSSKSGRASVILMIQAMKNLLKRQGTYEIVSQSINNCQLIAAQEDRRRLKEIFPVAKELSLHNQQPLLLTSHTNSPKPGYR